MKINSQNTALVIVDPQNDFLSSKVLPGEWLVEMFQTQLSGFTKRFYCM
jgi:nicotinamidase-related amidase